MGFLSILSSLTKVPFSLPQCIGMEERFSSKINSPAFLKDKLLTKTYSMHLSQPFYILKMDGGWEGCV